MIARFAELYPERVDSLVALCPAFDFKNKCARVCVCVLALHHLPYYGPTRLRVVLDVFVPFAL